MKFFVMKCLVLGLNLLIVAFQSLKAMELVVAVKTKRPSYVEKFGNMLCGNLETSASVTIGNDAIHETTLRAFRDRIAAKNTFRRVKTIEAYEFVGNGSKEINKARYLIDSLVDTHGRFVTLFARKRYGLKKKNYLGCLGVWMFLRYIEVMNVFLT